MGGVGKAGSSGYGMCGPTSSGVRLWGVGGSGAGFRRTAKTTAAPIARSGRMIMTVVPMAVVRRRFGGLGSKGGTRKQCSQISRRQGWSACCGEG